MDLYGLNHSIKSFAVANDFVINTNKACYTLGQQLQPFCIYANETQQQYGVLDFAKFNGFMDADKTLAEEIAEYRKEVYAGEGISFNLEDEMKRKLLFFDYLLTVSICYVEVPKYVTKNGMPTATFDKFLCTRNPAIMAAWMGCEPAEMQAKYSAKIRSQQVDVDDNVLRFVKLQQTAKGNSISVPRTAYSVEKMTCTPMYMLYAFIEGFKPLIQQGIVKFSYLKDNGTIRELPTTLNESILRDYYSDAMFVNTMLAGVDINSVQQGGMSISSKMNRGYIKVPELGASIYDGTGVRSLNIARLLCAEVISEVDRSFINVDLNSVVANFADALDYLFKTDASKVIDCYRGVVGKEPESTQPAVMLEEMKKFADGRSVVLSTTFHRSLHTFMITNPQWFPLYTGKPNATVTSSANYGITPMDF